MTETDQDEQTIENDGQDETGNDDEGTDSDSGLDTLKTFKKDELDDMVVNDLKEICTSRKLSTAGRKSELVNHIMNSQRGLTDRYIQGLTKCKICRSDVQVRKTIKQSTSDGRSLITRSIRCKGKHRHQYPLKEVV